MHCIIRSADRTLYNGDANQITARSPHGEFSVMNGHAPILAVLAAGAIRLQATGTQHIFMCKAGTFSLADDHASILVEGAFTLEEIDPDAIREQLETLQTNQPSELIDREQVAYLELLCRVKETHA